MIGVAEPVAQKIKKHGEEISLQLVRNPDVLAEVGALEDGPFTVGFAAETQDLKKYARTKLEQKNIEMIAANLVGDRAEKTNGTFNSDTNELEVYWHGGDLKLELRSKTKLARQLIALIAQRYSLYETNLQNNNNIISLKN